MIFSKTVESNNSLSLIFNKSEVRTCQHLRLTLNERLNFTEHINCIKSKCNKLIGITKKCLLAFQGMHNLGPRNLLSDLIWIMMILPMLNQAMCHLKAKMKAFNMELVLK